LITLGRPYVESNSTGANFETYKFGDLEVDLASREARVAGKDVGLKPREFALLTMFVANPGIALSRSKILETVWGFDYDGDDRTLDVHVRRLRMKIEELHGFPKCIHTLYGYGYRFSASRAASQACRRTA
jgi:DNA-binding response OmpR family regulator